MKNKIPTAEVFVDRYRWKGKLVENMNIEEFEEAIREGLMNRVMIEFAKLHCKGQAEVIAEKTKLTEFACEFLQEGANRAIDKDSILNAYNLEEEIK